MNSRLRGNDMNYAGIHRIKMMQYFVYILSSRKNGTIYIGVTGNLTKRVYEHKEGLIEGFTKKYKVHNLVYFEQTNNVNEAIRREKQLKKWNRQWKINLIEKENPDWLDLSDEIT
jgi:putative endonuclease